MSSGCPDNIKQRENHTDSSRESLLHLVTLKIMLNKYFLIAPFSIPQALECESHKYESNDPLSFEECSYHQRQQDSEY